MKKIFIVTIIAVASCQTILSQEIFTVFLTNGVTDSVTVYNSETDSIGFIQIKEDLQKDNWHDVEILGTSNNRYKVRIIPLNETNATSINGWVEKEQCGVWLRGRYIKRDLFVVRLYSNPGQSKPIFEICYNYLGGFKEYPDDNAVPVLDFTLYQGHYWIKTKINKGGSIIQGWTKDYCPDVYGSCN